MATLSTPPLLVLDLDGTLVDTGPDLIGALNHVLAADGFGPVPAAKIGNFVGRGARMMINRALTYNGYEGSEGHVDRLVEAFVDHYRQNISVHSEPYPHAREALLQLRETGWALGVCTNKMESLAVQLLDELDLLPMMSAVCGGDSFAVSKPDPRHLTGTVMRAGGDPERTVMVGDTQTDILTAKAAEIPIVCVDFGYSDEPIESYSPDAVISSFADLPGIANDLLSGRMPLEH